MFTRQEFDRACQTLAKRHTQWKWISALNPGYGFLVRTSIHTRKPPVPADELADLEEDLEKTDGVTCSESALSSTVNIVEHIVYSASFSVPAFYFTAHDSSGSLLPLAEVVQTSFFKNELPQGTNSRNFALTLPSGSFPLISQGDHPTVGTPWWYFHPCETDKAVGEFMNEDQTLGEDERLTRWLEIWLMIVGSILNV